MMDVEIIVKGGVELEEYYPTEYEAFKEKMTEMIMNTFPGVGSFCIDDEMTPIHQFREQERQKIREGELKQVLLEMVNEPEIQDLIRSKFAPASG